MGDNGLTGHTKVFLRYESILVVITRTRALDKFCDVTQGVGFTGERGNLPKVGSAREHTALPSSHCVHGQTCEAWTSCYRHSVARYFLFRFQEQAQACQICHGRYSVLITANLLFIFGLFKSLQMCCSKLLHSEWCFEHKSLKRLWWGK